MFPVLVDKKFKGKMKGASPALFTFELQFSVKQIDQFFSYRQSESCPPVFARRIYVGLGEAFKDFLLFIGGDTYTCVLYHELYRGFLTGRKYFSGDQADLALVGKFDGIGQKVTEHLVQSGFVGHE